MNANFVKGNEPPILGAFFHDKFQGSSQISTISDRCCPPQWGHIPLPNGPCLMSYKWGSDPINYFTMAWEPIYASAHGNFFGDEEQQIHGST